jgi:hypothetical protein
VKPTEPSLKSWWKKAVGGIRNAFAAEVINAAIKPVMIGDGVGDLGNVPLTEEKRQDVGHGVGHTVVFAACQRSQLCNRAGRSAKLLRVDDYPRSGPGRTHHQRTAFDAYRAWRWYSDRKLWGYSKRMKRNRASPFLPTPAAVLKPSVAAQLLGITLPEGIEYADLDPEPVAASTHCREQIPLRPCPLPLPLKTKTTATRITPDAKRAEVERFRRWAAKRANPDVAKFVSDLLSHEEKLHAIGQCSADGTMMKLSRRTRSSTG